MSNMVQCGDHKMAPASIVCVHLMGGASTEWKGFEQSDGGECLDWHCPACEARMDTDLAADDLMCVCMHCVRRKQAEHGLE